MATLKQLADTFDVTCQQLDQRWGEAGELWHDDTRRTFDRAHWQPLEQHVALTRRDLGHVLATIERARKILR